MRDAHYDVIIIGGGLLGASTAAALAKDGKTVLLLEAFDRHHSFGSSHGDTRAARRINFETPIFNETAADSLAHMRQMERYPGEIVRDMPALFIMNKNSLSYYEITKNMKEGGYKFEEINTTGMQTHGFAVDKNWVDIIDQGAATFNPSIILDRLYEGIEGHKGRIHFKTPVTTWESAEEGVRVSTPDADFSAKQLVIATGAWTPKILSLGNGNQDVTESLSKAMRLERIPLFYFDYPAWLPDMIPFFMRDDGTPDMYAMPEIFPDGAKFLKVGFHHGQIVDAPEQIDYNVSPEEEAVATAYMEKVLNAKMTLRKSRVCQYALTSDRELPLIDALPGSPNVYLSIYGGGVCAKHALALGRALSDRMQKKKLPYDMSELSTNRFVLPTKPSNNQMLRVKETLFDIVPS